MRVDTQSAKVESQDCLNTDRQTDGSIRPQIPKRKQNIDLH